MNSKYLKVALRDGTLDGILDFSMNDSSCLFTRCKRNDAKKYLNGIASQKGVFFLCSKKEVQVGITKELFPLIIQTIIKQDWWDNIYYFKDKDDNITIDELGYIKDYYYNKSVKKGTNRMHIKASNNYHVSVSETSKYLTFIDFAFNLFNCSLFQDLNNESINKLEIENTFNNKTKERKIEKTVKEKVDKSKIGTPKSGRVLRNEAADFIIKKGYTLHTFNFAKLNSFESVFWLNPKLTNIECDWDILLYNQKDEKLFLLRIPAYTFKYSDKLNENDKYVLLQRNDNSKDDVLEIRINPRTFIDIASGNDFGRFIIGVFDFHLDLFY